MPSKPAKPSSTPSTARRKKKLDTERVEICHSLTERKLLGPGADLDGEMLLPGFRYRIDDLFKEWDWE